MDDTQEKLKSYISRQLQTGQTPDEISGQLLAAGWPQDHVQAAFIAIQNQVLPTHMQAATASQPAQPTAITAATASVPQANGKRRGRIKTGWILFKESINILRGNKYLVRYFLMTWLWVLVFNVIVFLVIWFGYNLFADSDGKVTAKYYILASICYLVTYMIVNFYAAALASNILDIFKGNRHPYNQYVKKARSKFRPIFVYTLIESIIGIFLRFIVERIKFVGWIIAWLLGTAWSLGTMFVLPLIMDTDVSGTKAIKQSVAFFKQTWGENITAKTSVNAPLFLIQLILFLVFSPLLFIGLEGGFSVFIIVILIYMFLSLSIAILGSFANSLLNVALYYYAVHHEVPPGFDGDMLNRVFIKRKRRFFKKVAE